MQIGDHVSLLNQFEDMIVKYNSAEDLLKVFDSFTDATVGRADWGHAEHLIVAFHFALDTDFDTALTRMRTGIFRLLAAFEIDLTKEMPYHETLTVFWMRTVYDFAKSKNGCSVVESCAEMVEKFDKDYPLKFYSRELLFSDEARNQFVPADRVRVTEICKS